jgi:PBSX family phage terminase large subunit|nr:MAG TPA: large terminase [Caudoviricetes sp.]
MGRQQVAFQFTPFSVKQKKVLTWWCEKSPMNNKDGIIADGAIRSGKTLVMSLSYVIWAMENFNAQNFGMCGKTIASFRRNVLSFLLLVLNGRGYKTDYRRTDNRLTVTKGSVSNDFWIFGGRDESSQDLIQGMTLAGCLFDEVALMPQSFVNQATARCSVDGSKFWFNCNPENPEHWFKKEWVDKTKDKNILYLHFTMNDNLSLSEKVKERYRSMYEGVFYDRFIKGLWVAAQGRIYTTLDKDNIIDVAEWNRTAQGGFSHPLRNKVMLATIGVDFGGNGSATAFDLTLVTQGFDELIVADEIKIKEMITPTELERRFIDFAKKCVNDYPQLHAVYCDSAEQVLINGIRNAVVKAKLPLAVKNARKGPIIDRIRAGASLITQKRMLFVSSCKETYSAFNEALWDDKHVKTEKSVDQRLDDGSTNIDNIDATEYSFEPYINGLMRLRN